MIKFFRKIRQKLLSENKLSKYLIYAIGEIILLVIGILIALQLNIHNENRKLKNQELKLLQTFEESLKRDLYFTEWSLDINTQARSSMEYLIDYIDRDLPYVDSLNYHFGNITHTWGIGIDFSTYEELKSTGTSIISNESLKKNLIDYYSYTERFVLGAVKDYSEIMFDASKSIFSKHFDQMWNNNDDYVIGEIPKTEMIPNDYEQLKKDKEFRYFLKSLKNWHFWKTQLYLKNLLEQNTNLINEIENEISRLKNHETTDQ